MKKIVGDMKKFERELKKKVEQIATYFRIVAVLGPRQSGKTTLIKDVFPDKPYVLLEEEAIVEEAKKRPSEFLAKYKDGAIFDEIHNVPSLFSSLHAEVDRDQTPGRFVISSSQNYLLNAQITQTLTGRVHISTLLPLSLSELGVWPNNLDGVYESIFKGGYPQLHTYNMPPQDFFFQYLHTYVERDVRQLDTFADLSLFKKFLKVCASKIGQLCNYDDLAKLTGIPRKKSMEWFSILEAGYIVFTLPSYHKNFQRQMEKLPRIYFYDTGLACSLLEFDTAHSVAKSDSFKGALFENLVILEITKARKNIGREPNLYFLREGENLEVDLIFDWGEHPRIVEIKCSEDFRGSMVSNLKKYIEEYPNSKAKPFLVYLGPTEMRSGVQLVNLKDLEIVLKTD